jgi:hypothetical protein
MLVWFLVTRFLKRRSIAAAGIAFGLLTAILYSYGIFEFRAPAPIKELVTPGVVQSLFLSDYMAVFFAWIIAPICGLILAFVVTIDKRGSLYMSQKPGRSE